MGKLVPAIVVFFLAMNLIAGVAQSQGISQTIGIDTNVGGDEIKSSVLQKEVPTGSSTGSTLFGMYNVMGGFLGGIYGSLYPGLEMLTHAGVPVWITRDILGNVFSLLTIYAIASFVRGWDL